MSSGIFGNISPNPCFSFPSGEAIHPWRHAAASLNGGYAEGHRTHRRPEYGRAAPLWATDPWPTLEIVFVTGVTDLCSLAYGLLACAMYFCSPLFPVQTITCMPRRATVGFVTYPLGAPSAATDRLFHGSVQTFPWLKYRALRAWRWSHARCFRWPPAA